MKPISAVVYSCVLSVSCVCAQMNGGGGTMSLASAKWATAAPATKTMVAGTVRMDDGSPLPGSVNIQLACNGVERIVAQTNVLDDFGFQMSSGGDAGTPVPGTSYSLLSSSNSDGSGTRGAISGPVNNCDLRAELAGYRSTALHLGNGSAVDGINAGIIWLHRVSATSGGSNLVSISTLAAPKDAVKEFEKSKELAGISKLAEAAARLRKAVEIYPRFAEAWLYLGTVQYRMDTPDEAGISLLRARDIDPKLPGIYKILGYIAYDRKDWNTAVKYLDQAERLDPLGSVLPWYVSAIAYYELHRLSEAERSLREVTKLDTRLQFRRAQYLLGVILIEKGDVDRGTQALQNYLAASPDPRDVEKAKSILARMELHAAK